MSGCFACPRKCGAARTDESTRGYCGADGHIRVSRTMIHMWEEPCICKDGAGTGAVFFTGCPLGCVYCQNGAINHGGGDILEGEELVRELVRLCDIGARSIDLVSPTQYSKQLIKPLCDFKKLRPDIPVIYNTGGYESVASLESLRGLVDIYLTDFKYADPVYAAKYSSAPDYPAVARAALEEMCSQISSCEYSADGFMTRGVIVRCLVLPGLRHDAIKTLNIIKEAVGTDNIVLSLMSQYTPDFAPDGMPELQRRITTFEYESVLALADGLGFDGYCQRRDSAKKEYTPDFLQSSK